MTLNVVSWRRTSDVIDFLFMFFSKTVQEMYRYTKIALELTERVFQCAAQARILVNDQIKSNQILFAQNSKHITFKYSKW